MNNDEIEKVLKSMQYSGNATYSEAFWAFDNIQLKHYSQLDQAAYHALDAVLLADGDIEQRWFSVPSEKQDEAYQKIKAILKECAAKK